MILLVLAKFLVPFGLGMVAQWGISRKITKMKEIARLEGESSKRALLLSSTTTNEILNELSNRNDY